MKGTVRLDTGHEAAVINLERLNGKDTRYA